MPDKVSWRLNGAQANLVCRELRGAIDARAPRHGLCNVSLDERRLVKSNFLGIDIDAGDPHVLADLYQRGGDLVARYAQTPARPFAVLVYWRAGLISIDSGKYPYVDLLVSVETSLLESRPRLQAHTRLARSVVEIISREGLSYCLARFPDEATSYIELCHPDDALTTSHEPTDDGAKVTTRLFGQPLEKGVMLRSRLRGLFVPAGDADSLAQAALVQFGASPPPLTT